MRVSAFAKPLERILSLTSASAARSLLRATFGSGLLWLVGTCLTFLIGVQLARHLGAEGYGVYGVAVAVVTLLGVPAQFGLINLTTREVAAANATNDMPRLSGILRTFSGSTLVCSVGVGLLAAIVITAWPGQLSPGLHRSLLIALLLLPLFAFSAQVGAWLRGFERTVLGQAVDVLFRPALFLLVLFLVPLLTRTTLTPALALGLQAAAVFVIVAVAMVLIWLRLPSAVRKGPSRSSPKAWFRAAMPMMFTEGMRQLDGTYGVLLVAALATTSDAGLYRVALSSMALAGAPISLINLVISPFVAKFYARGDRRQLQLLVTGAAVFMSAGAGGVVLVFAVLGHWALGTFFGAEFAAAQPLLIVLCLAQLVAGLFGPSAMVMTMIGRERLVAISYLISVVCSIALAAILVPRVGAIGAGFAYLMGNVIRGVIMNIYAFRQGFDLSLFSLVRLPGLLRAGG